MVNDGMMERFEIDEVYGLHNIPGRPLGEFAIRPGTFYAATGLFKVVITGQGGHGAYPHEAVDPIIAASQIVQAVQTIASRNVDPFAPVVVSVTSFESSSKAYNVSPEAVTLKGTVRVMSDATGDIVEDRFRNIVAENATALGCTAEITFERNYPSLVNSEAETEFAAAAAGVVSGACEAADQTMWGEDFSFLLNARPVAYIHLGIGETAPLHHPKYDFNDDAIPFGCSWFVELAESRMPLG